MKPREALDLGPDEIAFVQNVVRKILGHSHPEVEDVTQDALILVVRHRHSFRGQSMFTTWMYRVAASACFMYLRKHKRQGKFLNVGEAVLEHLESLWPDPEQEAQATELEGQIGAACDKLPDKYHHPLQLRALGYTEAQGAEAAGINQSTYKTRLHRGLRQLGEKIMDWKRSGKFFSKEQKDEIRRLYKEGGKSVTEIATLVGCATSGVSYIVGTKGKGRALKPKTPKLAPSVPPAQPGVMFSPVPPPGDLMATSGEAVGPIREFDLEKVLKEINEGEVKLTPNLQIIMDLHRRVGTLEDENSFLRWWCEAERKGYVERLLHEIAK